MNSLTIINHNGVNVTDSREVALMIEKDHNELLKDIRRYVGYLGEGKIPHTDFFIESNYISTQNKELPCYLITKQGCEMVGNKMTGEKGVIFTARYVKAFNQMEEQLNKPTCIEDVLIQSLQEMKDIKQQLNQVTNHALEAKAEVKETQQEVQAIREVVEIRPSQNWREETNKIMKKIGHKLDDYKKPKEEVYKALQERGACDLKRRLDNMRSRLLLNGVSKSKANQLNYLDIIAEDKKLIEIYTSIVKEMAIKHKIA